MRALTEIVIKVFAAYLVFNALGNYVPLLALPDAWSGPNSPPIGYLALGLLVPIGIGIVLWVRAPRIAGAVYSTETPGPVIPESGVVAAGVFLIGVYWLIRSISVLVTQLGGQVATNYGWWVVLAMSVALILGNGLVAKLFRKLRTAGGVEQPNG